MDRATQLALNRLNQRFYAAIAGEWQDKRKHPWPGFEQLWQRTLAAASGSPQVLDVGCGDGRFAQYLASKQSTIEYLGLDNSPALLAFAAQRALGPSYKLEHTDILLEKLDTTLRFQLIAVLGVLHHVPGFQQRVALLQTLAKHLSPTGHLAFTIWRLDEDPRFDTRVVDLDQYNQSADEPLDLDQLEPGDHLLRWNDQPIPRYCHFPNEAELSELIASTGLQVQARYRADGHQNRMNEYVVLGTQP